MDLSHLEEAVHLIIISLLFKMTPFCTKLVNTYHKYIFHKTHTVKYLCFALEL